MSQILWTTLPVRIDTTGNAMVSVFVAPKLDSASLTYPMQTWPSIVQQAKFQIRLYGPVSPIPMQTVAASVLNSAFDEALWEQIFPPSGMAVKPFAFQDNSARQMWSYPVDVVHEDIKSLFASAQAQSPTALPVLDWNAASPLMNLVNGYAMANNLRTQVRQQLGHQWSGKWGQRNTEELQALHSPTIGLTPLQQAVWLAKRFYDRPTPSKDTHNNRMGNASIPAPPTFDFNERMAILADHPYLLRRLGLVIDLQFSFTGTPTGFVQVLPTWDLTGQFSGKDVTPRTAYEVSGLRFQARAGSTVDSADALDCVAGMLPLEDANRFYVTTGDPDGTMHKTVDFASNMANLISFIKNEASQSQTVAAPPSEGLPARRNTGVTITRKGRATALQSRFAHVAKLHASFEAAAPADLFSQDITRGYRVDVLSQSSMAWASLHKRLVQYTINGTKITDGPVKDEGYMKSASGTSDSDPNGPTDLYVHEKLFGWHGWSLAASRPGQQIMPDSSVAPPPDNGQPTDPSLPIGSAIKVQPGTLPSMRYGEAYRLRARAVDLAGNSLDMSDPAINPLHVTAPVMFGRPEPVPPPVLLYPSGVTEGESIENLVIRSNPTDGVSVAAMAASFNAAYSDPTNPLRFTDQGNVHKVYFPNCDRHVAPPKESQVFAEMHGDFDAVFAAGSDRDRWYRLGTREEGTFMDTRIASLTDTSNNGYINNPNSPVIVRPPQVPADQPPAVPSAGSIVANRGDPLNSGEYVAVQPSSGFVMTPYLPDSMAAGGVAWDPTTNANVWGKWSWGGAGNDFTQWPDYRSARISVTPGAGPAPVYSVGSSANGTLLGVALPPAAIVTLKYASTPRPDRLGHLQYVQDYQPQDDLTDGRHWMVTPSRTLTLVHAVQKPLAPPSAQIDLLRNYNDTFVGHSLTLTTESHSTGQVDLSGAWIEYIDDVATDAPQYPPTTGHAYQVTIPYGTNTILDRGPKHEFGDTKHRILSYTPTATTRFKEYFPPAIIKDPTQISVAGTAPGPILPNNQYSTPSSARPHAPKVAYIVPTFAWDESTAGQSVRRGGGLRVYLERPWYSSGQDEQLAVVITQLFGVTPATQPFLSMWGRDPVWDSNTNGIVTATAFPNSRVAPVSCTLLENGASVLVLPMGVPTYHPGKKLWFCDIVMDPGQTYFPFVSLALVRYQASSLKGVEISAVTRADFAQLVPDRTLNVAAVTGGVAVTLTGVAADSVMGPKLAPIVPPKVPAGYVPAPSSHAILASIQQRAVGSVGEIGWSTIGNTVSLSGQMPVGGGTAKWTGTLPVPAVTTGAERRVLVEEYEIYQADPVNNLVQHFIPTGQRLVYADTMPIPKAVIIRKG